MVRSGPGEWALRLEPEPLRPLPAHPAEVPWPSSVEADHAAVDDWPLGEPPDVIAPALDRLVAEVLDPDGDLRTTFAVVIVHRGRIVAESYGGALEHFDRPAESVDAKTGLLSWSMAKSILHSAVGILVADGALSLEGPAPVPEWADPADPRHEITIEDLLEMRDGLDFVEDYVDAQVSDVIKMLFGSGQEDVAAFASGRAARWGAGEGFSYSSGTTNVLAGILARTIGRGPELESWMRRHLFGPIGARSFRLGFDEAGTWVASSFAWATARDWARFGELQLRDGIWDGSRVLPEGWVDHGRLARSVDPEDGARYGAHWWVVDDGLGTFRAAGYEGQSVLVCPALDLVLVRLGKTPAERGERLVDWRRRVVELFASVAGVADLGED